MTTVPDTTMDADLARWNVKRLLTLLEHWRGYAAEPPRNLDHAKDKLQALAEVMRSMTGSVVERWNEYLISGSPTWQWDYYDGEPMTDPRFAESYARRARQGHTDG